MQVSPTRYARSGDVSVAYRVAGEGPIDLVLAPGWTSNVELAWEGLTRRFYEGLADFTRLIFFDKRGTGLSDRNVGYPTLEARMDDMRAVMDAVGSERAAVFGFSEGGSMSILFAATHPERTQSLITFGCFASRVWSPDYPWAPTPDQRRVWIDSILDHYSGEMDLGSLTPSLAEDEATKQEIARYFRMSASPDMAVQLAELNTYIDVREVLPLIRVPSLIMHREGDRDANIHEGEYIASRIPGAKFLRLSGDDHLPFVGDVDAIVEAIREFLTGAKAPLSLDRILTTILFTDIVGSTETAERLGDAKWRDILSRQQSAAAVEVERYRGRLIKHTGDGLLAIFDGPARAIRCGDAIQRGNKALGIDSRVGAHTGEVELLGDDIGGIAVHIAARIMAQAGPGQICASSVLKDL